MPSEFKVCIDCRQDFEYDEKEQEWVRVNEYVPPRRCKPCRFQKRISGDKGGPRSRSRQNCVSTPTLREWRESDPRKPFRDAFNFDDKREDYKER